MDQNCAFCLEPNIITCLNRSLYHKHKEEEFKQNKVIDELINRQKSPARIRFAQMIMQGDQRQHMNQYLNCKSATIEYKQLLQYYKYRIFVPVFSKSATTDRVLTYYYEKLKHYYNSIKRKLNITIQESLSSQCYSFDSRSYTRLNTKQQILKSLKIQIEQDKKKIPNLCNFKSQSKALEQLVSYLKLNPKFDKIKTLKTEDCFNEQKIFEETVNKKISSKIQIQQDQFRSSIKSKLFKKIIEGVNGKSSIPAIDATKSKQPLQSRSKSIKFLRNKEPKQPESGQKIIFIKYPQSENHIKSKLNSNIIPKRNSSLTKINQNHYNSPYKRKVISNEKIKGGTIQLIKSHRSRSNQHLKTKVNEQTLRTKDSLVKMQILKFQNTASYKSTPNSPSSSKKITRTGIEITKNDNILSIRKKKLQALKEKSGKK